MSPSRAAQVIVDAANVVGSRPDGWWRDRAGAARRLLDRLAAALRTGPAALAAALGAEGAEPHVIVVLEGKARDAAQPGPVDDDLPLTVVQAPGVGDDSIVQTAAELADDADSAGAIIVVTADRGLQDRLHAIGVRTARPGALLRALE